MPSAPANRRSDGMDERYFGERRIPMPGSQPSRGAESEPMMDETAVSTPVEKTPMPSGTDRPQMDAVLQALVAAGHGPLRYVTVEIVERMVVLRGRVPTFYLKQMAQTSVQSVPGVLLVRNELEVGGGDQ